ncbi:TPA: hypothetical protein DEX28_02605 [Patescibacteria group bacterium]|nr:MAG: Cytochrome c biogenesis protein transmembrane region [Parcubacteria group bacterium GW2011_GWA1_Parcubacteria_45_10]HCI05616.1 hypothetical protein [Patescibacteria group bacterium]
MEISILLIPSIVVAFVSGVIALFAPCCISFLLPAYLSQLFQRRIKVVLGTLFFSLGIAVVMLPVALGIRTIVFWFNIWHTQTYVVGGLIMIIAGILFLGKFKLPMPAWSPKLSLGDSAGYGSIFSLGVVSGLASSCCAPVLAGALTVVSLSPSLFQAVLVALSYVLGMVSPLFIAALLMKTNWLSGFSRALDKNIKGVRLGDLIGGLTMIVFGALIIFLALTGKVVVPEKGMEIGQNIYFWAMNLNRFLAGAFWREAVFVVFLIGFVWWLVLMVKKEINKEK